MNKWQGKCEMLRCETLRLKLLKPVVTQICDRHTGKTNLRKSTFLTGMPPACRPLLQRGDREKAEFHLRMEELRLYHGRHVKTSGKEADEGRDWCWETGIISSSTIAAEVVAGDGRDACSAQPPWLADVCPQCESLGKIYLNLIFSRDILCGSTHAQSAPPTPQKILWV